MTDTTLPPGDEAGDRIEPVDIQQEMQRSYIDYAMSVIVGRALPEVRDGLKPVHRRVLYAMYDSGFRPDRSHAKSARSVAETMGNYHPHGDASIYDTLVRMAQPWSLRYPLVDGQGNFGSPGNDPPAAMRYCVSADTSVALASGESIRIADIVPGALPNTDNVIDIKVLDRHGNPVRADRLFHSGEHETYTVRTVEGCEVTGTGNHPLLCLVAVGGVPTLLWKLIDEIRPGDCAVMSAEHGAYARNTPPMAYAAPTVDEVPGLAAFLLHYGDDADAAAIATELTDGRFYYAKVAAVTEAGVQPVYSLRVDTDDHAFITNGFVSHNTEARLTPLAMEMLREIDEETVDFIPNYDGRVQEPTVLPSRFPNLLANGSGGIAVGMATNIPPHNLRELAEAVFWCLENHEADEEATLAAVMERVKGPDFPTSGLIVGTQGIGDAYKTGRGSIRMRGVVEVEEARGRTSLVITELPYQVNHDNFITSIAEQVRDARLAGIANIEDQSSDRVGLRIVIELKRDAVAKVVLNNLYKHTQLQTSFGANMLAIVDGVPRTLRLDQLIRHYVAHQLDVIVRRTTYRLRKANERAHILRGLVKALDALDEVIALIRASETVDIARTGLIELLDIDEIQAQAILDMQLRRLAALERQRIIDDLAKIEAEIADLEDILAKPERQRAIVRDELTEIVDKHGDDRRTRIVAADGEVSDEDLIAREDVVVTITETGYAKRTKTDLYRSQKRGGKGVQGAGLKQDDIVAHFFVSSTHDWILFFTTQGRVYRAKAYELPEASRTARGQHVANLLAFQPEERIAQVIQIRSYEDAPYLVLATRNGLVKKTKLTDFDSNRSGGIVAINLRDSDELVGAVLCSSEEDLLLVSANGQSIRFSATDEALRPMGRATSGVQGMRFNADDYLLSLNVVREGTYLLVATSGGYAKRTAIEEYPVQGRGGKGVLTVQYDRRRGRLVGALIVDDDSELYAITSGGGVIRTAARQVRKAGRQTKGVRLMNLGEDNTLLAIARNAEEAADEVVEEADGGQDS
ncbi:MULTISPECIES: intein-containing DNA gyrase subunit A [unclassified Mycobacterium]|uniref:intein-containing DNA gyrase subunit A n=1 Tax=unclassified Mycobacterium TaxID=2642494 RepID=UPI0007FF05DB|nr:MULTISPECIES: intein-containing DNA gyrase subunit A [unclassified Mycobacterium]OBH00760.1 DNA gyrase subunit A [Mycobacterium sp. E2699]OBI49699.1 DNA gyrase subunit A [Mycobacterium sp. E787]